MPAASATAELEQYAEADQARRDLIEESNKAESVCAATEKALNEFKDELVETEKEKVAKPIGELRAAAAQTLSGDVSVSADIIRGKIYETQLASLCHPFPATSLSLAAVHLGSLHFPAQTLLQPRSVYRSSLLCI